MIQRVPVAVALGSNLGDRRGHLQWAAEALSQQLADLCVSPIFETEPVDVPDIQPAFLNAAATGLTTMGPLDLLAWLLDLERLQGRTRRGLRAARTLDLDLILYGDKVIDTSTLTLPHPRFRERLFVLEPLAHIAPDWCDPLTGLTMAALLDRLR